MSAGKGSDKKAMGFWYGVVLQSSSSDLVPWHYLQGCCRRICKVIKNIFTENTNHLQCSICCRVSGKVYLCSETRGQPGRLVGFLLQQPTGQQLLQRRAVLCSTVAQAGAFAAQCLPSQSGRGASPSHLAPVSEGGNVGALALTGLAGTAVGSAAEPSRAAFLLFAFQPGLEASGYLQGLSLVLHEHSK